MTIGRSYQNDNCCLDHDHETLNHDHETLNHDHETLYRHMYWAKFNTHVQQFVMF